MIPRKKNSESPNRAHQPRYPRKKKKKQHQQKLSFQVSPKASDGQSQEAKQKKKITPLSVKNSLNFNQNQLWLFV